MIKINVIINDNNWLNYIRRPNDYLNKKINKLNLNLKELKKNHFFALYCFQETSKLNILIRNLEKKIKLQIYCHFRFNQKKN